MYYLVYTSAVLAYPAEPELQLLFDYYLNKINKLPVSGLLLYLNGHFIHVLEGDKEVVWQLYQDIQKDKINQAQKFILLIEGDLAERNFAGWHMGFKTQEIKNQLGFINLQQVNLTFNEEYSADHPSVLLLQRFYNQLKNPGKFI